jgi:hypothetical protein
LIDEEGEVRELTLEDFKHFRPVEEVLSPELLSKIKLHKARTQQAAAGGTATAKILRPAEYTTKQLGDACEMLIAGELTLAGIPALRVPDSWPGYDVIAHPPQRSPQRISVKSRTKGRSKFIDFEPHDFDWLAVVLLDGVNRRFFVLPSEAAIKLSRPRSPEQQQRSAGSRCLHLTSITLRELCRFENNFKLQ